MRRALSIEIQPRCALSELPSEPLQTFASLLLRFRSFLLQFRVERLALLARFAEPAAEAGAPW